MRGAARRHGAGGGGGGRASGGCHGHGMCGGAAGACGVGGGGGGCCGGAGLVGTFSSDAQSVSVQFGNQTQEILVHGSLPLEELHLCLMASFELTQSASSGAVASVPVALKDQRDKTVYPLSLVTKCPRLFRHGTFQLVVANMDPLQQQQHLLAIRGSARDGNGKGRKRHRHRHGARRSEPENAVEMEALRGEFGERLRLQPDEPVEEEEEEDEDDNDDEEEDYDDLEAFRGSKAGDVDDVDMDMDHEDDSDFVRELDLADFELPQLVNVFTQACPTGALDRTTFERCLEKILSQNGRYDPLARKMFAKLFEIFDTDKVGVTDVCDFLGGLSVLASGERDEKIRFTFDLYDTDNDGFISLDEMTKYLTAVFLVIAETSPELFERNQVGPIELGSITARQCFKESELNHEGKLSYESFHQWYARPGNNNFMAKAKGSALETDDAEPLTLEKVREMTGLGAISPEDLLSEFSSASHSEKGLTRKEFRDCFARILASQKKRLNRQVTRFIDRLFDLFDADGSDTVDLVELGTGLSVLCNGAGEAKIAAAFQLIDADGNGFISEEEMENYLASVFTVVYESVPSTKQMILLDPKSLAKVTTKQAFEEADQNHDGQLSFEEFRKWYANSLVSTAPPPPAPVDTSTIPPQAGALLPLTANAMSPVALKSNTLDALDLVGSLTNLGQLKPEQVFETLAARVNEEGVLDRQAFYESFESLLEQTHSTKTLSQLRVLLDELFDGFDADKNGVVDFCELCTGLSVFCDGSQEDKIRAAFHLYDVNHDGFLSRDEMQTYLASVFRVVFMTCPQLVQGQNQAISPEQLATITTEQAFEEFDQNRDERLSFEEFTEWYTRSQLQGQMQPTPPPQAVAPAPHLAFSKAKLEEMKRLTNLSSYDVKDIADFFLASADTNGNMTKLVFFRCFNKLLAKNGNLDHEISAQQTRSLLEDLFALFDADQNGLIDARELGSGLTILCGGDLRDKAESLFKLYDLDHDGYISPDEMESYLTAVFKILLKSSPELRQQIQMSETELAAATSRECFDRFDVNHDGRLNLDEFYEWFRTLRQNQLNGNATQAATASSAASMLTEIDLTILAPAQKMQSGRIGAQLFRRASSTSEEEVPVIISLEAAKKLSGLQHLSLNQIAETFASYSNEDGQISRPAFDSCFEQFRSQSAPTSNSAAASTQVGKVLDRLFMAFDTDHDGFVDFNELTSGLSVLCQGKEPPSYRVRAAFDLYDANGDGHISKQEMVQYLASVFKLLYSLDPTRQRQLNGMDAWQLAVMTMEDAFAQADTNRDGQLSFEEFEAWYTQSEQANAFSQVLAPMSLDEMRRLTNLGQLDVVDVFERFAENADDQGLLSLDAFQKCFLEILDDAGEPISDVEKLRAQVAMERLFKLFAKDVGPVSPTSAPNPVPSAPQIDFGELASGLSVLCKGSCDAKVKAAFSLYDFNNDGFISLEEMTRYLTSVFKVLYDIEPMTCAQMGGLTPEQLGILTAEQAFLQADVNHDGRISFEEFLNWYRTPDQQYLQAVIDYTEATSSATGGLQHHGGFTNQLDVALNETKRLLRFAEYNPERLLRTFSQYADEQGMLSKRSFFQGMRQLVLNVVAQQGGNKSYKDVFSPTELMYIKRAGERLFQLFDADHNNVVDSAELASGLSLFCGGNQDERVRAAFSLFDFNQDGSISLEEMKRYLTAVFRVLYELSPQARALGVSPEELGMVTAEQAFMEADANHDGKITFEEFKKWYQFPGGIGQVARQSEPLLSLSEAKRLTNLEAFSPMEIFEVLAESADDQGLVSKAAFDECFYKILRRKNTQLEKADSDRLQSILTRLFDLFDVNKTGFVDFSEISSGLSVFCGGTSDEKVRAAFTLYDYNNDGFISQDEMTRYLVCVFKVLKETSPLEKSQQINSEFQGMTPEELGASTAQQAFEEADRDRDGRLSFEEFREWYTNSNAAKMERLIEQNIPEWLSLREVRRLTNLSAYTPSEVFEVFASVSSVEGTLTKEAFHKAFEQLIKSISLDDASRDRLRLLVDRLFSLFDTDSNGVVDFSELASGLSVLCGGSQTDKVRAAFNLYDVNHDGFISLGEMRLYLTSVFKVLYEVNPDTQERMGGISADELGAITAEQAFMEADMDKDGRLSFEEFSNWYTQPNPNDLPAINASPASPTSPVKLASNHSHVPEWVSLEVVKKMTHLDKYTPSEVFERFAQRSSDDGTISREAFEACFQEMMDPSFQQDEKMVARLRMILERLFTIFDSDGNGVVDFCELSCGLSVLCGGSRHEKVRSAFGLYDLNQSGALSLDELVRYLTSVFKVLYETNPGTQSKLGVPPEELAMITAEQCFEEAKLNEAGCVTFEEFSKWYSKSGMGGLDGSPGSQQRNGVASTASSSTSSSPKRQQQQQQPPASIKSQSTTATSSWGFTLTSPKSSTSDVLNSPVMGLQNAGMEHVKKLLRLDVYEVNDIFEIFAEAAPSGELNFAAFKKCFEQMVKLAGGFTSDQERQEAELMIRRLFKVFDTDQSNTVDFGELASGLSILSGSTMEEKVRAAFQLYDLNGDGFISLEEMISYMTSVFKVMYETSASTKAKMEVDPSELARITAAQCFKEADLNHDQKLSFDEFKRWCTSGGN